MPPDISLLYAMYAAFNARDADAVLAAMTSDVAWPKAWEGGFVVGQDAIREYWARQWAEISPTVEIEGYMLLPDGRLRLEVRQTVHDLEGNLLSKGAVGHTYTFRDGLVSKMEIEGPGS